MNFLDMTVIGCLQKANYALYPMMICAFNYTGIGQEAFFILAAFMVLDTIAGVIKTIAIGKKPTSRRFTLGVVSKLLTLIVPMVLSMCLKVLGLTGWTALVNSSLALMVVAEGYSFIQNVVSIRLQKEIEEYDAITKVLTGILNGLKNSLDSGLPKY